MGKKLLNKLQNRINDEVKKFEEMRGTTDPDPVSTSKLGRANDRLSKFIDNAQKNQSQK